jgi:hypothetical protein
LFTGVVVTGDEFIAVGVVTGDNCSLMSSTPVIKFMAGINDIGDQ